MSLQTTQSLLTALSLVTIASIVSSLIYLSFRWFQSRYKSSAGVVSLAFGLVVLLLAVSRSSAFANLCFPTPVIGLLGTVFHQKSTDKIVKFPSSFGLMFTVTLFSLIANFILIRAIVTLSFPLFSGYLLSRSDSGDLFWLFVTAQSMTTPFLIWAWKISRLRPGVDKHLDT